MATVAVVTQQTALKELTVQYVPDRFLSNFVCAIALQQLTRLCPRPIPGVFLSHAPTERFKPLY
ncbi:MAG: hypothetical protein H7Z11_24475 [Verrucomicrobia bacterium]|nr:hypothetical protein [Leptolyngbya sp. ES-bin-22]